MSVAATIYVLIYLVWIYVDWGGEAYVSVIENLSVLPMALLAVVTSWRVAAQRSLNSRLRAAWLILGLAIFSFGSAAVLRLYGADILPPESSLTLSDIFHLGTLALLLLGLLVLPSAPLNRHERWQFLLDFALIITVVAMYAWYFVIGPMLAGSEGDFFTQALDTLSPICDLIVLSRVVAVVLRRPDDQTRSALSLLILGLVIFVAGDLVLAFVKLTKTYVIGNWPDAGADIAVLLVILAAVRQSYLLPTLAPKSRWLDALDQLVTMIPFISIGLGYGLVIYVALVDSSGISLFWLLGGPMLLAILFIGRQFASSSFTNLSLRAKLIWAFLGMTILSVGVVALVVNQVIRVGLTNQVGQNLHALSEVKAQQIGDLLDEQEKTLKTFALSPTFRDALEVTSAPITGDDAAFQAQLQEFDQQWDVLVDNDPVVLSVLSHTTSRNLREFQQNFPNFIEVFVTNQYGQLVGATQRTADYSYAGEAWWQSAYNQGVGGIYIGQPEFNNQISAFGVIVAVPVRSRFDNQRVIGVLRSTYSLAALTEGLAAVRFGQTGHADLLLPSGQILSSDGSLESLKPEFALQFKLLSHQPYLQFNFHDDTPLLVSQALIRPSQDTTETAAVQQLNWKLVVDQEAAEALASVNQATQIAMLASLGALVVAGLLGLVVAQLLAAPITRLTAVAAQLTEGNLNIQAPVESNDEIGALATTLNGMTAQLKQTLLGLEDRSQRLEIIAGLSEHLSVLLKVDQLLAEVVNQIKDKFGYYHAQIYLLNENPSLQEESKQGMLVVAADAGAARAEMKARGHSSALNVPTSLVARAANSAKIVRVDDVRATVDWLPNPLLPDTRSEMAVPIILEGQVVGVLDVQEDRIAGLSDSDAYLLRTLANQVAVGIKNARQFAQVETALAEARAAQQRYIIQAWDKTRVARKKAGRVQYSLGAATPLDEKLIATARQHAWTQSEPTVVTLNGDAHSHNGVNESKAVLHALVAPLRLHNTPIGNLQLYPEPQRTWTESELALINTVIDQVAQAAENLRLVNETQERASREQLINQISEKLRRAPDMETLLRTGVTELTRILGPARTFAHLNLAQGNQPDQSALEPIPGSSVEPSITSYHQENKPYAQTETNPTV
jgi:GAF domain-containing protein